MSADIDLLILGGGCAGLSLARELAAFGARSPSTCILEQRAAYGNDRTWCFWGHPDDPLAHLVQHQWSTVTLHAAGQDATVDFSRNPYRMISGSRFYEDALQVIASAPQVGLETGVRILSAPRHANGWWEVDTSAGIRRGRQLVDTRPGPAPRASPALQGSPLLWQSFHGREIVCSAPVFDPTKAILMDFIDDGTQRILFTYLLPTSPTRALIEVTVFSPSPATADALASPLQREIRARVGSHAFTVARSEYGVLPMGLAPARKPIQAGYLQVGLMHGGARASTGYAFQRIQRWARHCAARLAEGAPAVGHAQDPMPMRGMDRLFLSLLRNRPDLGPALFLRMFQRADADTLVRFLSDRASMRDYLDLIRALPALPFLRQLGRNLVLAS